MGMKGNAATFPVVKQLLLLCAQWDVELETVWKPRSDAHQQIADFWSKIEDSSDFNLHSQVYDELFSDPLLAQASFTGQCWMHLQAALNKGPWGLLLQVN